MTMTTIKVDSDLRDSLNAAARTRGLTTGALVQELFDHWRRDQRFAALREAMARTSPDQMSGYLAEVDAWDGADDPLRDEKPFGGPSSHDA